MGKKAAKSGGSAKWLTTFADLSTLLLTFFVIMLSMANVDIEKFREMLGSVKDAFGVQFDRKGDYQARLDPEQLEQMRRSEMEKQRPQDQSKQAYQESEILAAAKEQREARERAKLRQAAYEIREAIDESDMGDMAEIQSGTKGVRVRVKGTLLFDPGEAELKAQAKPFLDNLIVVLNKSDYFLLVEGHTDSMPIATQRFPSNWELSGNRASMVLRYLISKGIDRERLTCVGLADTCPLATNDTGEGRARNRRVEFVLTKQRFRPAIS